MSLPDHLTAAYRKWHQTSFTPRKSKFESLISQGQHPEAMVISCCDSRVMTTDMLGAQEGDFFMHRNIANFVPAHQPAGESDEVESHGTGAALEYGVTALGVRHIIVVGHAKCGGVQGCFDLHSGANEALNDPASYVGRWVKLMRPSYEAMEPGNTDMAEMERQNVLVSLAHIRTYPFVQSAIEEGRLELHGLWHDIAQGVLYHYSADKDSFIAL